ncbi:RNA polymerase RpoN-/SigL-like sigma 54 subunit [Orbus hercynius]|uniref:RNA polymerase sigma-54 factor n=1 Tax=Orbus hercynius TaxID=593135 RepID=A0A495REU2_9GAMM|nr:RNA polymerase RpoN-/SigL-like sigma 54 subunit [Orbus hercynius]
MKPSLQLKISQQLTMTPQLQQAIRLLQLSTLELCQEIQTSLENNPLLEIDEHYEEITVEAQSETDIIDTYEMMENREISEDIPFDASLEDIYTAGTPSGTHSDYRNDEFSLYQGETHQTLNDYLMWQLNLSPFSERDKTIAVSLIQAIDDRGYLTCSLQDILEEQGNEDIEIDEVETVLKRVQYFDPVGIGARSLQECLLIQINQLIPITNEIKLATCIIKDYLDQLGQKDYKSLTRQLNITPAQLKQAIDIIQQLQPYPGESINTSPPEYVIPDVLVKKVSQKWHVIINHDSFPKLKINQHYASMVNISNESDGQYIRQSLQNANWLIKSIENRNETLTKVSQFIVDHQQDFFEYGEEHMKPMILADIANAINMHESTISRVTTLKYLQCPRGIFELKYFFSSHVTTKSGGEASSTAIRALIKKLVQNENSQKPLSDSKITNLLKDQGMIVARRTIAKYRESLSIPPSSQRKQLK